MQSNSMIANLVKSLLVLGVAVAVQAQPVAVTFGGGSESSCTLFFQKQGVRRECKYGREEPVSEFSTLDGRLVSYATTLAATVQDARCNTLDGMHGVVSDKGILAVCDDCLNCRSKTFPVTVVERWKRLHELYWSVSCVLDAPRIAASRPTLEDSLWKAAYDPILDEIRAKPSWTSKDSAYLVAVERRIEWMREDSQNACKDATPILRLEAKADSMLKVRGADF